MHVIIVVARQYYGRPDGHGVVAVRKLFCFHPIYLVVENGGTGRLCFLAHSSPTTSSSLFSVIYLFLLGRRRKTCHSSLFFCFSHCSFVISSDFLASGKSAYLFSQRKKKSSAPFFFIVYRKLTCGPNYFLGTNALAHHRALVQLTLVGAWLMTTSTFIYLPHTGNNCSAQSD